MYGKDYFDMISPTLLCQQEVGNALLETLNTTIPTCKMLSSMCFRKSSHVCSSKFSVFYCLLCKQAHSLFIKRKKEKAHSLSWCKHNQIFAVKT